jgi:hypothetical protein
MTKILIVEDQKAPQEALERAVDSVVLRFYEAYTPACRQI